MNISAGNKTISNLRVDPYYYHQYKYDSYDHLSVSPNLARSIISHTTTIDDVSLHQKINNSFKKQHSKNVIKIKQQSYNHNTKFDTHLQGTTDFDGIKLVRIERSKNVFHRLLYGLQHPKIYHEQHVPPQQHSSSSLILDGPPQAETEPVYLEPPNIVLVGRKSYRQEMKPPKVPILPTLAPTNVKHPSKKIRRLNQKLALNRFLNDNENSITEFFIVPPNNPKMTELLSNLNAQQPQEIVIPTSVDQVDPSPSKIETTPRDVKMKRDNEDNGANVKNPQTNPSTTTTGWTGAPPKRRVRFAEYNQVIEIPNRYEYSDELKNTMYNSRKEIRELAVRNRQERKYELKTTGGGYINDDDYCLFRGTRIHPVYVPEMLLKYQGAQLMRNGKIIPRTSLELPKSLFVGTMNTSTAGKTQLLQQHTGDFQPLVKMQIKAQHPIACQGPGTPPCVIPDIKFPIEI